MAPSFWREKYDCLLFVMDISITVTIQSALQHCKCIFLQFFVSPQLATFVLSIIPPLSVVGVIYGRYLRKVSKLTQDSLAEATQVRTWHGVPVVSGAQYLGGGANQCQCGKRMGWQRSVWDLVLYTMVLSCSLHHNSLLNHSVYKRNHSWIQVEGQQIKKSYYIRFKTAYALRQR